MVMVFDCETIVDVDLVKSCWHEEFKSRNIELTDDYEISKHAMSIQREISGSEFMPLPFHRIVSISAVFCDEYGYFKKVGNFNISGNTDNEREKSLISGFFDYINKSQPKLVSFNGRGFDIPVLLLRAMKYKIQAEAYFEVENTQHNKSKWDNYRHRYSERFHTDLYDVLSNYSSTRGLKLDIVSNLLGFPGKYDVCGDMVLDLYYKGDLEKIDEYCQSDTLNTYGVYLNYELLQGNIDLHTYRDILAQWIKFLPKDKEYYQFFFDKINEQII